MRRHHLLLLGILTLTPSKVLAVPTYTITDLGTLPGGDFSIGSGINARGQVTGRSNIAGSIPHAFLWDPVAGMRDLLPVDEPASPSSASVGNGINDNGQVTGWAGDLGVEHAFLWDPVAGIRDLEPQRRSRQLRQRH